MSILSKSYINRAEKQKSQVFSGVDFIYSESELDGSVQDQLIQTYSEVNSLRDKVNEMNAKLLMKEEECKKLRERVDTLTKQKIHRDNVIEEHKKIQRNLREKIENMMK